MSPRVSRQLPPLQRLAAAPLKLLPRLGTPLLWPLPLQCMAHRAQALRRPRKAASSSHLIPPLRLPRSARPCTAPGHPRRAAQELPRRLRHQRRPLLWLLRLPLRRPRQPPPHLPRAQRRRSLRAPPRAAPLAAAPTAARRRRRCGPRRCACSRRPCAPPLRLRWACAPPSSRGSA